MPTGGFAGILAAAGNSGNAGANSIFLTPVTAQKNGVAVAVLLDTPAATSGVNLKALVYDGAHSALLAAGLNITSVVGSYNRLPLATPLNVTAGTTYYVGYVCDSGLTVSIGPISGLSSWFAGGGQSVASPANPLAAGGSNGNCLTVALEMDGTGTQGYGYSVDQSAGVTLSAANTVATFASTAQQGARSLLAHSIGGGKYYAEIAVNGPTVASQDGIGFIAVAWGPNQILNGGSYSFFLLPTGFTYFGVNLGLTWGAGDVVGLAYNSGLNFIWWNKNNGPWFGGSSTAGNPVTGGGGYSIGSGITWPLALSVLSQASGSNCAFTLRDTASSLQYAPPSGYAAWSPFIPGIDLSGNLGGSSHYGKLSYGKAHYSRISAFAPIFSADLGLVPVVNFAGGLTPIIVLAADLDVHVNLIDFSGALAPQIALGGSLSLDLPLTVLEGGLTPIVALAASSFVSGPLWASSEPGPPSLWTPVEPCDPVVWSKSELCNG